MRVVLLLLPAALAHAEPRWGAGVGFAAERLTPTQGGSTNEGIALVELAGHFRPVFNTELQLALDLGGRDDAKYSALWFDVRYRFNPDDDWRFSLTAGVGVAAVYPTDPSDAEKKGRGALRFGVGGDRKLGHFCLGADLRMTLIAHNDAPEVAPPELPAYYLARSGMYAYGLAVDGSYAW